MSHSDAAVARAGPRRAAGRGGRARKIAQGGDQLDNIQANSEATKTSVDGMKTDVATLQATVTKLQTDNAALRQQLTDMQAAFDQYKADQVKARQTLIDNVADMIGRREEFDETGQKEKGCSGCGNQRGHFRPGAHSRIRNPRRPSRRHRTSLRPLRPRLHPATTRPRRRIILPRRPSHKKAIIMLSPAGRRLRLSVRRTGERRERQRGRHSESQRVNGEKHFKSGSKAFHPKARNLIMSEILGVDTGVEEAPMLWRVKKAPDDSIYGPVDVETLKEWGELGADRARGHGR